MAGRKPADPGAKLALLLAAKRGVEPGCILSMADMAKALDMTARNLKLTIDSDPELPVASRGGQGVAWALDAHAVMDHMIAKCRAALSERSVRDERIGRLTGLQAEAAQDQQARGGSSLSPHEMKQIADAQMTAHRLKREQGRYMLADEVTSFLNEYHSQIQGDVIAMVSRIDPSGQIPLEHRRKMEEASRTMLVELQGKLVQFLAVRRVPSAG